MHFCLPKNEPKKAPRTALAFGITRLPLIKAALQKLASLRHAAMLFALPSSLLAQVRMGKIKIKTLKPKDSTVIRDEPKKTPVTYKSYRGFFLLVATVCYILHL